MTDTCARVFERLVEDPDAASAETDVAAHLGSCLDCFRALTELRDAARIAELLRRPDDLRAPEPGAGFWDALAARTVVAMAGSRGGAAPSSPAPRPPRAWARAAGQRRGAVLLVAAAAAVIIGVLGVRGGWPSRTLRPSSPGAEVAGVGAPPGVATEVGGEGFEEGSAAGDVSALEAPELRRLLEGLRQSEPDEIRAWFGAGMDEEDGFADQVAGLDARALQRLARALGGSTL